MACMCGDICCPSCGPAQGNHQCPACGIWQSDGGCFYPLVCEVKNEIADAEDYLAHLDQELIDNTAKRRKEIEAEYDKLQRYRDDTLVHITQVESEIRKLKVELKEEERCLEQFKLSNPSS